MVTPCLLSQAHKIYSDSKYMIFSNDRKVHQDTRGNTSMMHITAARYLTYKGLLFCEPQIDCKHNIEGTRGIVRKNIVSVERKTDSHDRKGRQVLFAIAP